MKAFFSKSSSQKTSAAYSNTTKPSGARVVYLYEDGQPIDGRGVRMEFTPDVCRTLDDVSRTTLSFVGLYVCFLVRLGKVAHQTNVTSAL